MDCVGDPFLNKHNDLKGITGDPSVKPSDLNIRTDQPPTTMEIPVGSNENTGQQAGSDAQPGGRSANNREAESGHAILLADEDDVCISTIIVEPQDDESLLPEDLAIEDPHGMTCDVFTEDEPARTPA